MQGQELNATTQKNMLSHKDTMKYSIDMLSNRTRNRLHCLVKGYIKNILQDHIDHYPMALNIIFMNFLGNVFLKFDRIPVDYKKIIKNDGMLISSSKKDQLNKSFIVGCSEGMNSGINEFKVQCTKVHKYDAIAIISDINECHNRDLWINDTKRNSYIFRFSGWSWSVAETDAIMETRNDSADVTNGDIVRIYLDCDKSKIKYSINGFIIREANITPNITYYFAMGLVSNSDANREYAIML